MVYNRRDLIGHWIRREQRPQQPCTHACCRGYRVHPANYPVILPDRTLRRARDDDLARHYQTLSADPSPRARRGEAQVLHEMERRDRAELEQSERASRKQERARNIANARAGRRMERESETERIRLEAEAVTKGYLVSAEGRSRGIADAEVLTGREAVFRRYATPEAREYFASNPRPTAAYFRGKDTRVVERAPQPRRPAGPRQPRKRKARVQRIMFGGQQ